MRLYRTLNAVLIEHNNDFYQSDTDWDKLVNRDELHGFVLSLLPSLQNISAGEAKQLIDAGIQAPIGKQEVWAAGVTYFKSMEARMEESKSSGGADLYDRVYQADRPELFFKALPHRVSGHGQQVNIRRDSIWNVPEPELTLFISSSGNIQAYTIGNDMSSRSIEGDNALYLPQAKIYEKSTGLGPCLFVTSSPLSPDTTIEMTIERNGQQMYRDHVKIKRMKRTHEELVGYLYRECDFFYGSFLMTGTCLVPPAEFTLQADDIVHIHIDEIGVLTNIIGVK